MSDLLLSRTSSIRSRAAVRIPRNLAPQVVMASPPTLTTGSAATLTRLWPLAHGNSAGSSPPDGVVSYARCEPEALVGTTSPVFRGVTTNAGGTTWTNVTIGQVFWHYGSDLELAFEPSGTSYLLKVDDAYVSLTPTAIAGSGTPYHKWAFGSAAMRRIEIVGYNTSLTNLLTANTDSVSAAPVRGPKVIILGDSFTAVAPYGIGLAFGDAMGWDDIHQSGLGGTGYVNPGSYVTFGQRAASDVIRFNPDVVIVLGLANDYGQVPATVATAATALYAALRAGLPSALICAAPNVQFGWNGITANALAVYKAVKAAAIASGVSWLDLLEAPAPTSVARQTGLITASSNAANVGSGIVPMNFIPPIGSTVEIDGTSATIGERVVVKSITQRSGDVWDVYIDGVLQYNHTSGVSTCAVVGNALVNGTGTSASPSAYGNADICLDGTRHPTPAGAQAYGYQLASLFCQAFDI